MANVTIVNKSFQGRKRYNLESWAAETYTCSDLSSLSFWFLKNSLGGFGAGFYDSFPCIEVEGLKLSPIYKMDDFESNSGILSTP